MDFGIFLEQTRRGNDQDAAFREMFALIDAGEAWGLDIVWLAEMMMNPARSVLAEYDHRSLNDFLEYPSVENICELISSKLKQKLQFPFTLRVWEGHGKWAEI